MYLSHWPKKHGLLAENANNIGHCPFPLFPMQTKICGLFVLNLIKKVRFSTKNSHIWVFLIIFVAIPNRKNVYNVINSIFWVSNFKKTRMEFVKRLAQQESLRNALASPHSDFIVMYGRRSLLWHPLPTRRMWSMYFSFGKNRFLLLSIARSCFQRTWQRCWNNINVQFTQCHGSSGQSGKPPDLWPHTHKATIMDYINISHANLYRTHLKQSIQLW